MKLAKIFTSTLIAAAAFSGVAPAAQSAEPHKTTESASCELSGGKLSWGLKESFRAYISGSIAHGSWDTSDGATYQTPNFIFEGGSGSAAANTGANYSFAGKLHFTGHDGVLDLTIANPTVRILSQDKAVVLLDMRSTDTSGNVKIDEKQVPAVEVKLTDKVEITEKAIKITAAPASLAASGVDGFGGFYSAGEELDPLTFETASKDGCILASLGLSASEQPAAAEPAALADPPAVAESQLPWLPIGIGAVALLVIGVAGGVLVAKTAAKKAAQPAEKAEKLETEEAKEV